MENNQRQIISAMMMQAFILRGEGTIEEAIKMADLGVLPRFWIGVI